MKNQEKRLYPHELIGEEITVIESNNKANIGITGKIINETKMTLTVNHDGKRKTLLKNIVVLKLHRTQHIIRGAGIIKRPEDRVKGG